MSTSVSVATDATAPGVNGHDAALVREIQEALASYIQRGWAAITYDRGLKHPQGQGALGWQEKRVTLDDVFSLTTPVNTGLRTGSDSQGLYDLECDVPEAQNAAHDLAPATDRIHGRESSPSSHRWYQATDRLDAPIIKWEFAEDSKRPNAKTSYVELRGNGCQSMCPPSKHPSGERVRWDCNGDPGKHAYDDLRTAGGMIASTAIAARHWPNEGTRNQAKMAMAGGLVRSGWADDVIDSYIQRVARLAGDEEWQERKNAQRARELIDAGAPATGIPRLATLLTDGVRVVDKWCEWLGLDGSVFGSGLPRIKVADRPLRDLVAESMTALEERQDTLTDDARLYLRHGGLVWLVPEVDAEPEPEQNPIGAGSGSGSGSSNDTNGYSATTTLKMEPLRVASLAVELSRAANFAGVPRGRPVGNPSAGVTVLNGNPKKLLHVMPPDRVVKALIESREWQLPGLRVVTGTPILHRDGSILDSPGYDPLTQALYWPARPLQLPKIREYPTPDDALKALAALEEPFVDFPFDDAASRANNLGLLLTFIVRQTIHGLVPLAAIDAPDMGYGKSLLVHTHARIATGRILKTCVVPTTEEEWGKQVVSWLGDGRQAVLLDNVEMPLWSPVLEQVLTSPEFSRRNMGVLKDTAVPNTAVWIATGNNLIFRGALERRRYLIRMSGVDVPWARNPEEFKHADLPAWVLAERPRLLAAAYTLYRFWLVCKKPAPRHKRQLASFEEWSRVIGGILDCVGVSAFLEGATEQMGSSDPSRAEWEGFLTVLAANYPNGQPFKAVQVFTEHLMYGLEQGGAVGEALPEQLLQYARDAGRFSKALGRELMKRKGRVIAGFKVVLVHSDTKRGNVFALQAQPKGKDMV